MNPRSALRIAASLIAVLVLGCSSSDDDEQSADASESTSTISASVCPGPGLARLNWPGAGPVVAADIDDLTSELTRAAIRFLGRDALQVTRAEDGPSGCRFNITAGTEPLAAMTVASTSTGGLELQGIDMPADHPESLSVSIAGSTVHVHYRRPLGCPTATELIVAYGSVSANGDLDALGDIELTLPSAPDGPGTLVLRTTDEAGVVACLKAIAMRPGDFAAG